MDYPVRTEKKPRRIEQMTVMLIRNGDKLAIRKRPAKGLLPNLYEFPNTAGILSEEEAVHAAEAITNLEAIRIKRVPEARHIFSHVEWHMRGYEIIMTPGDEKYPESDLIYAEAGEIEREYPIPSAFTAYAKYLNIHLGKKGPSYK